MLRDLLDYLLFKSWTVHNEAVNDAEVLGLYHDSVSYAH